MISPSVSVFETLLLSLFVSVLSEWLSWLSDKVWLIYFILRHLALIVDIVHRVSRYGIFLLIPIMVLVLIVMDLGWRQILSKKWSLIHDLLLLNMSPPSVGREYLLYAGDDRVCSSYGDPNKCLRIIHLRRNNVILSSIQKVRWLLFVSHFEVLVAQCVKI